MNKVCFLLCSSLLLGAVLLAGCGDDESSDMPQASAGMHQANGAAEEADTVKDEAVKETGTSQAGPRIVARDSEFGEILVDSNDQAIYIFENDSENETVCYGECAQAWPPVLAQSSAVAGSGVDKSLFGTVMRRDGDRQVTYAGQPLYYYAHEGPGQVLCHNVNLNGGFWWVIGPDGERRP